MRVTGRITGASHPGNTEGLSEDRTHVVVKFERDARTEMRADTKPNRARSPVAVEKYPAIITTIAVSALPSHQKLSSLIGVPVVATIDEGRLIRIEAA